MKTKLAVWLAQKKFADNVPQAMEVLDAISMDICPPDLLDRVQKDIESRIAIGGPITETAVLAYLKEKLKTAEKLIAYWEEHPKDTNAIFFLRRYQKYQEEGE